MQLGLAAGLDRVVYYGRGPHENYWDRKTGAALGLYQQKTKALAYDYVRPQENGNRCDCRWIEFRGEDQPGLRVVGLPQVDFSVWPYTLATLEQAQHTTDLAREDHWTVNLDYRQMGVGGDNSWSDKALPMPQYQLTQDEYILDFALEPL
jgi:beta-galactosidase